MHVAPLNNNIGSSCLLNSCICAPFVYVANKVRALVEAIFGYLLRIITFQIGVMNENGAGWVIRLYQKLISCDPREDRPFDPERLNRSEQILTSFGGVGDFVDSEDGNRIHYMTFKSENFFRAFERLGSVPIDDILYNGQSCRALPLHNPQLEEAAAKFFFPIVDITMLDGTIQKGAILPKKCLDVDPPHFIDFHSWGRTALMNRRKVGRFLAAGYDLTIWDPPGSGKSSGSPTEGNCYLAADAVFRTVLNNVPANKIYLSGYCVGGALATYLKRLYHHLGVHLVVSNPYTSMREVVENYGFIGRWAAHFGMDAIQDRNLNVPQDYFDNENKLRNLPRSEGKLIVIHTDPDTMMPRGTAHKLIRAFDAAGPSFEILRIVDQNENGHLMPPDEDDFTFRRLQNAVSAQPLVVH